MSRASFDSAARPYEYFVWGKLHGSNQLIKLHGEYDRRKAVAWMFRNKRYYDDMRVYAYHPKEVN